MKRFILWMLALFLTLAMQDTAQARTSRSGGGHGRSSKSTGGYIVRHCKTEACFKKHPSGSYGFTPGQHKRKD